MFTEETKKDLHKQGKNPTYKFLSQTEDTWGTVEGYSPHQLSI